MLQQVTVSAETPISLKPLLRAAIQSEIKMLAFGINRTRERLTVFEKQFNINSVEFERRFTACDLNESLDFIEWEGEIKTLRLLEEQQAVLQQAHLS
jgi:hypothetical protein